MTRFLFLVSVALALTLSSVSASPREDSPSIHIILSSEDAPYRMVVDSVSESMGGRTTITVGIDDDMPEEASALVTVGVAATQLVLKSGDPRPVFAVMVPASSWQMMTAGQRHLPRAAIYLDQPYSRQLALISAILPAARDIGVVLGPVSIAEETAIGAATSGVGLRLHAVRPATPEDVIPAVTSVLRRSDALLAIPDPTVYNRATVRNVLLTSFSMRRPLFGFSAAWIEAGAIATIFSTPAQSGADLADMLHAWLDENGTVPASRGPTRFSIAVNRRVAFSLGINAPTDEVLNHLVRSAEASP